MKLFLSADGACEPNPGDMAIGVVIKKRVGKKDKTIIHEISEYIGEGTNNQAEYNAVLRGLQYILEMFKDEGDIPDLTDIIVHTDSQNLVKQISGVYEIHNPELGEIVSQIQDIRDFFKKVPIHVHVMYIPGAHNSQAHDLAEKALIGDEYMFDTYLFKNYVKRLIDRGIRVVPLSAFRRKEWECLSIGEVLVMELCENARLSTGDAAKELGRDYSTIYTQHHRAKEKLKGQGIKSK